MTLNKIESPNSHVVPADSLAPPFGPDSSGASSDKSLNLQLELRKLRLSSEYYFDCSPDQCSKSHSCSLRNRSNSKSKFPLIVVALDRSRVTVRTIIICLIRILVQWSSLLSTGGENNLVLENRSQGKSLFLKRKCSTNLWLQVLFNQAGWSRAHLHCRWVLWSSGEHSATMPWRWWVVELSNLSTTR